MGFPMVSHSLPPFPAAGPVPVSEVTIGSFWHPFQDETTAWRGSHGDFAWDFVSDFNVNGISIGITRILLMSLF